MKLSLGITPRDYSVVGGAVAYDTDAQAFFTSASITDTTQKNAVNQLVLDLKSASIWTKMKAIYPVVGGVASSHAVNLKTPGTYNLSFATGWTHSVTGMTPLNTYADTFLNLNTAFSVNDNIHYSYYSRTNTLRSADTLIGVSSPGIYSLLNVYRSDISNSSSAYINTTSVNALFVDSNSLGHYIGLRNGTNIKIFKNGVLNNTATGAASTRPAYKVYIGAYNEYGTAQQYSNRQCAFSSIGDGLTDAEASSFYTAVQNYQTTLGRQV